MERLAQFVKAVLAAMDGKDGTSLGSVLVAGKARAIAQMVALLRICAVSLGQAAAAASGATAPSVVGPQLRLLMLALRPEAYTDQNKSQMVPLCREMLRQLTQPESDTAIAGEVCLSLRRMVMQTIGSATSSRSLAAAVQSATSAQSLQIASLTTIVLLPFDEGASTYVISAPPSIGELTHLLLHFFTIPLVITRLSKEVFRLILQRTAILQRSLKELSSPQFAKAS
jgi:hypothetical protein